MMIWVHGFLMPERGETESLIFFLVGGDRWSDGSMERQKNRNKKAGPKARKKIQLSEVQVVAVVRRNLCVRGGGGAGARRTRRTRRWVHSRRVATIAAALVSRGRRIRTRRSRARFGTWRSV